MWSLLGMEDTVLNFKHGVEVRGVGMNVADVRTKVNAASARWHRGKPVSRAE
jgi:hypothetical protein